MGRMKTPRSALAALALLASGLPALSAPVSWEPWSDAVFARARREHRFVLLDLEAVWCHWCHVMDETTYRDPRVAALLGSDYLAVRVDQDSRPDLAARYGDYGWPATVIYGPDGSEIVKRQGYVEPDGMVRLLKAVVADPSPVDYRDRVPDAADSGPLPSGRRSALRARWLAGYDRRNGGWGDAHKFLDWDNVEFALRLGLRGDAGAAGMARDTLRLQRRLLDPVWGGMYQYSVGGGWDEPHFEKIMPMQAEDLRIYALACAQWGDPAYRDTAEAIHRYLVGFLMSPEGAFYVSQDADLGPGELGDDYYARDDAGRRALGIPRIDTHLYARENGWAIAGLAQLAATTGDPAARREAIRAADWVVTHRGLPGGGFRHGEGDPGGPYLGDTLAMGRAFYALYELTADRSWLDRASAAADFIRGHFGRGERAGFAASDTGRPAFPEPVPEFDENVALARFALGLAAATGRATDRGIAESALRWLLAPGVAERQGPYVGGLLLAEEEARTAPLHVAVVGGRDSPVAAALYAAALRAPTGYKLVEWWDRRDGPAPRGEDIYPDIGRPAAYLCANGACSAPVFTASDLAARIERLGRPPGPG
jgi:uncharacterized protein YyaL (SSP411 family)